jgi:hypothetical protein
MTQGERRGGPLVGFFRFVSFWSIPYDTSKGLAGRQQSLVCRSGHLRQLKSEELKQKFKNPSDADEIQRLADKFVDDIRAGTHTQMGWSNSMYGISKLAEIAYTMWLSRQLQPKVRLPPKTHGSVCPFCAVSCMCLGTQKCQLRIELLRHW